MMDIRKELLSRMPKSLEAHAKSAEVVASEIVSTVDMPNPFYVERGKGSRLIDIDGNEYIDLTMGFGPHILGYAPDPVVKAVEETAPRAMQFGIHTPYQEPLARLIAESSPAVDQIVFSNSGTEATLYAIRAARAYSGKTKIAMFDGSYHGAHDGVLAIPRRGAKPDEPLAFARGSGVPTETVDLTAMLPYRSEIAFDLIRKHKDELALVMLEPVQSSNPRTDQKEWLQELREVCREAGVLFMLDEVITGFRLAWGGGQELFDVQPDLVSYGKVIGGGMPIGAVGGRRELMRVFIPNRSVQQQAGFEPLRPVFSAGTFSGNPLSMAAGRAQLDYLKEHADEVYPYLSEQSDRLSGEVNRFCEAEGLPARLLHAHSMLHLHFTREPIETSRDLDGALHEMEREFYLHLLYHGVVIPGLHIAFLSTAHSPEDVDFIIDAFKKSLSAVGHMAQA